MVGQHKKLEELLNRNGWDLVEIQETNVVWEVEFWLIKSNWSPQDCYIFLSFEVDPEEIRSTPKPPAFRIVASLRKPIDWFAESEKQFEKNEALDDLAFLYLKKMERGIPEFIKDLANLRQKFYNFYN